MAIELSRSGEMTTAEAQNWKQEVVSHVKQLRVLLDEGHRRSAWRSLGFTNWTDCLKSLAAEFGLSERRLWQLHSANQTERLLNPGSVGEIPEKHLRPLANLKAEDVSEVWQKAKETAPDGKVTTAHIEQTVSKYFQEKDLDGFYELIINSEFQNLLPSLTEREFSGLEASILRAGVRSPIVVWAGVLIDGHQRYAIAKKHSLPFKTVEMQFDDETEAKIWIIDNQLTRKNLSIYEQAEVLLKAKEYLSWVN
ncbi:MAG: ParB N-terminal domain-containing protein [Pyrinomonadaceae bacterium]